jgi:hypothetical protein
VFRCYVTPANKQTEPLGWSRRATRQGGIDIGPWAGSLVRPLETFCTWLVGTTVEWHDATCGRRGVWPRSGVTTVEIWDRDWVASDDEPHCYWNTFAVSLTQGHNLFSLIFNRLNDCDNVELHD